MAKYHYFFDPLCGWCYGSTIKLAKLLEQGAEIELLPIGLFSQTGRVIDAAFAYYAWKNDQRIQATQQMMTELGLSGVPQLFDNNGQRVDLFCTFLT